MRISFKIVGDKELARRMRSLSRDWGAIVTLKALAELNVKLMSTLTQLFGASGGGPGELYAHGYTGKYLSGLRSSVREDSLEIYETVSDGGKHIREGTGPSGVDERGQPIISHAVIEWAIKKLGKDDAVAQKIARSVALHGIGWSGGASPLAREKPMGEGRFAYPDWIVTEKNRGDLETLAKKVGIAVVTYLER